MKKRTCFVLSMSIVAMGLASCGSILAPGDVGDYYRVDLYSDYSGIEADMAKKSLDTKKARHLGYCYAKKNNKANVDGRIVDDGWEASKSTRTPAQGFKYVFEDWVGFYADGTAVDLNNISSPCSVFASFEAVKKKYVVKLINVYDEMISFEAEYETKLGDYPKFKLDADITNHDPLSYGYDPYFEQYQFAGYQVTTTDDNETKTIDNITASEGYAKLNDWVVKGTTRIEVVYASTKKSYDVNITPVYRDDKGVETNITTLPSEELKQNVRYDASLAPTSDIPGYSFLGFEGTYGKEADISLRGKKVDASHIRGEVNVKAVYVEKVASRVVKFHVSSSSTKEATYFEGGNPIFPDNQVVVPDYYGFTGAYSATEGGFDPIDFSTIFTSEEPLDAYPIFVPLRIQRDGGKTIGGKDYDTHFYYRFERAYQGYVLENFALTKGGVVPSDIKDKIALEAGEFWDASSATTYTVIDVPSYPSSQMLEVLSRFNFVGIHSFASPESIGAPGSSANLIESIAVPTSVKYILNNGFASLTGLGYEGSALDLSHLDLEFIGKAAFRSCVNLTTLKLPKLKNVDEYLFNDCDLLTSVSTLSSEEEVKALVDSGKISSAWNKNYDLVVAITYAA